MPRSHAGRERRRILLQVGLLFVVLGMMGNVAVRFTVWDRDDPLPGNPGAVATTGADLGTVGVPPGVALTPSFSLMITRPGTIVEGRDVKGSITVAADDVTIRDTRVTSASRTLITIEPGVTGVRIQHVELDGLGADGAPGSTGIHGSATVIGADIHSVENGVIPRSGSVVRDSYIHSLAAPGPDASYEAIRLDGGPVDVVVKDNTIDLSNHTG